MTQRKQKTLKESNILFVAHNYKDWIKDPVELIAKKFNHVYVLVWHKPIADLLKPLTAPWFLKLEEKLMGQSHTVYTFEYKFDLKNLPKNVTVIPVNMWYLPFKWWIDRIGNYHFKQVDRVIRENNISFDIIHAHSLWSAGYVGKKLKEKYGKPLVVTGHGRDVYQRPYESGLRMKRTKQVLEAADELTTVSSLNAKIIKKLVGRDDVAIIPNGIKTDVFKEGNKKEIRKELGFELPKKYFITVGHVEAIKGQMLLVQAIKQVIKKNSNLRFIIVGKGGDYEKIKQYVVDNGLEKYVILTGILKHEDVAKWMMASDYYVLPSLAEGNPTVMFEALACGLPFLGTKVGGVPEVVNSKVGVLVKPGSVNALVKGIQDMLKKRWNVKGILNYGKEYDWNVLCEEYIEIYSKLLKG